MKLIYFLILMMGLSYAGPIVITDSYIGGVASHKQDVGKDVIGSQQYDITQATVDFSDNDIIMRIYADYFKISDIDMGDLFLSVDGYRPGDENDDYLSGEEWEYVLKIEKGNNNYGDLNLYRITDKERDIIVTNEVDHGQRYRTNQELYVDTGQAQLVKEVGSWSIGKDYVQFSFNISELNIEDMGFHWTMKDGHDVIEGSFSNQVSVPEPSIYLLFIIGVLIMLVLSVRSSHLIVLK